MTERTEATEMELRVAKAIFAKMFPERPEQFTHDKRLMDCYIDRARAAIRAMRELPTDVWYAGVQAGREQCEEDVFQLKDAWVAMIDSASPPKEG